MGPLLFINDIASTYGEVSVLYYTVKAIADDFSCLLLLMT